ncbi:MAG: filamentous hemagglutinin N-terminal domain-containing protein [Sulfuritalea sp.]|nr:filamentous hemagglutinin N-terminal domain-containing protein [Sulfuritalea sp.]
MSYKNPSPRHRSRLSTPVRLGAAAVAACFIAGPVLPNPLNPVVVNGSATFNQAGPVLTVTNSNGTIINWQQFNIKVGETTHFAQTAASSTVLNRVLNDPTAIYGTLSSNGRVWLVNPAGIMVGPGGRVDTAGFVASTLNIRNEDFLAGRKLFENTPGAGSVINQGEIRTPAGGSVYLIGSSVTNEGIITTPGGETILAAGATVSLIDSATPGVKVDITGSEGSATNLGQIAAEAGRIGIAGVIVRNSGQLNASSVVNEGGRIFLKASQDAYVDGNGRIVTTGTKGGSVEVLGKRVAVMDSAEIDASGTNGGGKILVGGDYQGKNPEVQNADVTYFGPGAGLKADATGVGAGGTAIVWADDTTRAYGNISAKGGAMGGDGGFVETSGHRYLDIVGVRIDTSAPNGAVGKWLLDPTDITILPGSGTSTGLDIFGVPTAATATVYAADINSNLSNTDAFLSTASTYGGAGSIVVTSGVSISNTSGYGRTIGLEATSGINMQYGATISGSTNSPLSVAMKAYGGSVTVAGAIRTYGGNVVIAAKDHLFIGDGVNVTSGTFGINARRDGASGGTQTYDTAGYGGRILLDADNDRNSVGTFTLRDGGFVGTTSTAHLLDASGNFNPSGSVAIGIIAADVSIAGTASIKLNTNATVTAGAPYGGGDIGLIPTNSVGLGTYGGAGFTLDNTELSRIFMPSAGAASCGTGQEGCRIWIGNVAAAVDPLVGALPVTNWNIVASQADFSLNGAIATPKRVQLSTTGTVNDAGTGAYGGYFGVKAGHVYVYGGAGIGTADADGLSFYASSAALNTPYGSGAGIVATSVGGGELALRRATAGGNVNLTVHNGGVILLPYFAGQMESTPGDFSLTASGDIRFAQYGGTYTINAPFGSFTETAPSTATIRAGGVLNLSSTGGALTIAGDHAAYGGMNINALGGITVTDGGLATKGALSMTAGGDITLTGVNRGVWVKSEGAMTIQAANLYAYGGAGVNPAGTYSFYGSSAQTDISSYGAGVLLGSYYGQTISATNEIALRAGTVNNTYGGSDVYGGAVIFASDGNQSISAKTIKLFGGANGHDNFAVLEAKGDQVINAGVSGAGSIDIYGGGAGNASSNNYAGIQHGDWNGTTAYGSGNLTVNLQTAGSSLSMYGGAGTGNQGDTAYGCSPVPCQTSNNFARIRNDYGGLTINTPNGSSIAMVGGGAAADYGGNAAGIDSRGNLTIGSPTGRANISLTGGTAGGQLGFDSYGGPNIIDNSASIAADGNGNLTVYAGTITLAGGSAAYGGALMLGKNLIAIDTTGNLALTGGSGNNTTGNAAYGWVADSAGIGNNNNSSINLNVGGNLTLTGGTGTGSMAGIGSNNAAVVTAQVTGNVTVTANASGAGIGSVGGYGGAVTIYGGQDITFGSNTWPGNAQGSSTGALMNLTLLAKRDITLGQSNSNLYGGNLVLTAGWNGNTSTPTALATSGVPSSGNGGSIMMDGTQFQTSGAATIDVRAYGGLTIGATSTGSAGLFTTGYGGMTVLAHDVTLNGGYGGLAYISMDGPGTQTVTATNALTLNGAPSHSTLVSSSGYAIIRTSNTSTVLGAQHISAHQINMNAGGSGSGDSKDGNFVLIKGTGTQTVNITGTNGGIALYGGGAGTSGGSNDYAQINQISTSGSQTLNLYGGAAVSIFGGTGNGTNGGLGSCYGDAICGTGHPASNNSAGVSSYGNAGYGGQTLNFLAGGALTLQGGSNGVRNQAYFSNFGTGGQQILGAPVITLTGGTSGGDSVAAATDGFRYLLNNASIFAPYAPQTISAASLTLNGAGAGANPNANASAWITGKSQTINVTGGISVLAGATAYSSAGIQSLGDQSITAASLGLQGGSDGHGNKAAVLGNGVQTVTLTGSGNVLTLTGGSGVGSYDNYAQIMQLAPGGTQTIALTGTSGGNIIITGGSGAGTAGAAPAGCAAAVSGDPCYGAAIAHNNAGLYSTGSGGQTVAFGYGGALSMYGGSVGNQNSAFIQSVYGGQTISGNEAIALVGGTSGGAWVPTPYGGTFLGNGAVILSDDSIALQAIYGNSITLTGNTAIGGAGIRSLGSAGQTVSASGAVTLTGGSVAYGGVGILSLAGQQTFTAQSLSVAGGSDGHDNIAVLEAHGNQTITLTGSGNVLTLTGGGGVNGYNNLAAIGQKNSAYGQTISLTGAGANVVLRGGTGAGLLGEMESGCVNAGLGAACQSSNNNARIQNNGAGGQTINYAYGGGTLAMYGGNTGYDNSAEVDNSSDFGTVGSQQILGNPNIIIQGGTSGGKLVMYGGSPGAKVFVQGNQAGIFSDHAQTINAASLTLTGGSGAATFSPAILEARVQNINVTGAITLQGGSGTATSVSYGGSYAPGAPWSQVATGAVIGNGDDTAIAIGSINIKGGSISAYGGAGTSGAAMIGSMAYGATINLGAYGDIVLRGNVGQVSIGSAAAVAPSSYGGVNVTIGAGNDLLIGALGSGQVGIGTTNILGTDSASVTLSAGRHLAVNSTGSGPVVIGTATATTPVSLVSGAATNPVMGGANPGYGGDLTLGTNTTISAYGSNASLSAYGGSVNSGTLTSVGAIYGSTVTVTATKNISLGGTLQASAGMLTVTAGDSTMGSYGGNLNINGILTSSGDLNLVARGGSTASGSVANYGGASALSSATRWRVFSDSPAGYYGGGLVPAFREYSATSVNSSYGGTGNGVLFSVSPAVTSLFMTGTTTRQYDATTASNGSGLTLVAGTAFGDSFGVTAAYVYDNKNAGTGKLITATVQSQYGGITNGGVPVYGLSSTSFTGQTTTAYAGTITVAPLTIAAVTDSRVYNGTTSSSATPIYGGTLYGGDTLTGLSQSFASKHVLGTNGSTLNVNGGYVLNDGNAYGGNYNVGTNMATGSITPFGLIVSGATAVSKDYDSTAAAVISGGILNTFYGDAVLLSGGGSFADRHVGTGKPVTTNLALGGSDATNYTLTQPVGLTADIRQRSSLNWSGSGGDGMWSNPANWTSGIMPDGGNVAYVDLGGANVTFDGGNASPNFTGSASVGIANAGTFTISGGYLAAQSLLSTSSFVQSGGYYFSSYGLTVGSNFSQSAGGLAVSGPFSVTQASGNLSITNGAPLTLTAVTVSNGNFVLINSGGIATGASQISVYGGSVAMTAHSPIAIGSGGIVAGNGVSLSAPTASDGSTVSVGGSIAGGSGPVALNSYGTITQNANISGSSISMISTGGDIALSSGVTNTVAGGSISLTTLSPSGSIASSSSNFVGATPVIVDGAVKAAATTNSAAAATTVQTLDTAVTNTESSLSDSTTATVPPPAAPPPTTTTTTSAPPPLPEGQTLGGTMGTFGGDSTTGTTSTSTTSTASTLVAGTTGTATQAEAGDKPAAETKKDEGSASKPSSTAKEEKKEEKAEQKKDDKKDEKKDEKDEKDEKEKKDKKDKKSDEAKDEKKDEKSAQKKVAQCT